MSLSPLLSSGRASRSESWSSVSQAAFTGVYSFPAGFALTLWKRIHLNSLIVALVVPIAEGGGWRGAFPPAQDGEITCVIPLVFRNCLTGTATRKVLIIQTDFEDGVHSAQLIASAKYAEALFFFFFLFSSGA